MKTTRRATRMATRGLLLLACGAGLAAAAQEGAPPPADAGPAWAPHWRFLPYQNPLARERREERRADAPAGRTYVWDLAGSEGSGDPVLVNVLVDLDGLGEAIAASVPDMDGISDVSLGDLSYPDGVLDGAPVRELRFSASFGGEEDPEDFRCGMSLWREEDGGLYGIVGPCFSVNAGDGVPWAFPSFGLRLPGDDWLSGR